MPLSDVGFQSSQLFRAIELVKSARSRGDKIVLAFTGNIISSGLREYVAALVRGNHVEAVVTSGAGVEEDLIKTFGDYRLTEFNAPADGLIGDGLFRIGNLAVPCALYDHFDDFLIAHYEAVLQDPGCDKTPGEIAKRLGSITGREDSFLYWADRNHVSVYCPTFHDGAIGDFLVDWHREGHRGHPDFILESVKLVDQLGGYERCGAIILGGGTSKHFALNAAAWRGGYDWSVVVSTAVPFDGSDSGGDANEAKTWRKLSPQAPGVLVYADATLVFPTLVEQALGVKTRS